MNLIIKALIYLLKREITKEWADYDSKDPANLYRKEQIDEMGDLVKRLEEYLDEVNEISEKWKLKEGK